MMAEQRTAHRFVLSKKKKNVDKISLLPDCLLHQILSLLNTKQVVQTSVLSKRWKSVWTNIPTLNFDFNSYPFDWSSICGLKTSSFKHFIFNALSRYCGQHIKKLSYTSSTNDDEGVLAKILICYARSHMVQEFFIDTSSLYGHFNWGWCLSEWKSLTVLKMSVRFEEEWGALNLPSLRSLEIETASDTWDGEAEYVGIDTFSGCPNLEHLVLVDYPSENFSIWAPKLENLELLTNFVFKSTIPEVELRTPNLKCIKFRNFLPTVKCASDLSYLEKVNIAHHENYFTAEWSGKKKLAGRLSKLLRVFHNARSLTMPLEAMQLLLSVPSSLSGDFLFHNLRHLKLKTKETRKMIDLPISLWAYFQNSPTLKNLLVDLN